MKKLFLCVFLGLAGCNEVFAPDVIMIEEELDSKLTELLEFAIREELCDDVEKSGYDCNIPEQIKSINFKWLHDKSNTVRYELEFCLKENCPIEDGR